MKLALIGCLRLFGRWLARDIQRVVLSLAALAVCCSLFAIPIAAQADAGAWLRVRTKNFQLVGNTSERDLRRVATRLVQYREVFSRRFDAEHFTPTTPTLIFVFRDDASYEPFKPLYRGRAEKVAGYFQSHAHVNYITLSLEQERLKETSSLVLHEYVHLLVKNRFPAAPLWLKEGLADYYSTAALSGEGRKLTLGKPIRERVFALRRESDWLPLSLLFSVDAYSPHYHEPPQRDLFYAESWALAHYLLNHEGGARRAQLSRFLDLLATGAPVAENFREAFGIDFAGLERELKNYVRHNRYPVVVETFDRRFAFDAPAQAAPLTEAERLAHLGDLLLHIDRPDEAVSYLQKALTLAPQLAPAQTSLGILRLRQNCFAEAKRHLQLALAADPQNHLAHYAYADALSREGLEAELTPQGYAEKTRSIRAALKKSIELAPQFLEAYRLLAWSELERSEELDEAAATIDHALKLAPQRQDFALLLAQLRLRRGEFTAARELTDAIIRRNAADTLLRTQAERLRGIIVSREESAAHLKAQEEARLAAESVPAPTQPCDMPEPGPQLKHLRFNGEQICGQLVNVECEATHVLLFINTGGRTLKLHNSALNRIRFVTYTTAVRGQITCGPREPAPLVLVTYRAAQNAPTNIDGEAIAVEFMPPEWRP